MIQIKGNISNIGNISGKLNGTGGGGGGGATTLNGLTDVNITNPQNDNILKYSNGVWINSVIPDGIDELSELGDVSLYNLSHNQVLQYHTGTQKWSNVSPERLLPLTDLQINMYKLGDEYQANMTISGEDLTNKIIDIHFNYAMVQLLGITITPVENSVNEYEIFIRASYDTNVNDMKVLLTYRDVRT